MRSNTSNTSSIGAMWPAAHATHERFRGFCDEIISSPAAVGDFVREFVRAQQETEAHPTADRLSIRAVVDMSMVPALSEAGLKLEAALPVANQPGRFVTYAAWNAESRRMDSAKLIEHLAIIRAAQGRQTATADPYEELVGKDYRPKIIDTSFSEDSRRRLAPRFFSLYGTFGFTESDVDELLTNPDNTIAYVADQGGSVVSTVLAERATLELASGQTVNMIEITEAVTAPYAQGQGLYRALSGMLISQLLEQRRTGLINLDVLYGESNLSSPGVIVSAHCNGRRFSLDDASMLGQTSQPGFGILEQNVSVNDGRETRAYNDFAITYVPLDFAAA